MIRSYSECVKRYGSIEDGIWKDERRWMEIIQIPAEIGLHLINSATGEPTARIYCNKDMSLPLLRALDNARARGLLSQLKSFDGCFMIRSVRGFKTALSAHSYGLAIDINAKENPLGIKPKMSAELVQCFTDESFTWGGSFRRPDGMHFSFCFE